MSGTHAIFIFVSKTLLHTTSKIWCVHEKYKLSRSNFFHSNILAFFSLPVLDMIVLQDKA